MTDASLHMASFGDDQSVTTAIVLRVEDDLYSLKAWHCQGI